MDGFVDGEVWDGAGRGLKVDHVGGCEVADGGVGLLYVVGEEMVDGMGWVGDYGNGLCVCVCLAD